MNSRAELIDTPTEYLFQEVAQILDDAEYLNSQLRKDKTLNGKPLTRENMIDFICLHRRLR